MKVKNGMLLFLLTFLIGCTSSVEEDPKILINSFNSYYDVSIDDAIITNARGIDFVEKGTHRLWLQFEFENKDFNQLMTSLKGRTMPMTNFWRGKTNPALHWWTGDVGKGQLYGLISIPSNAKAQGEAYFTIATISPSKFVFHLNANWVEEKRIGRY